MAFYDNPRFLLSHIRHSFITCDDTGMCEMVMLHEVIPPEVTPLNVTLDKDKDSLTKEQPDTTDHAAPSWDFNPESLAGTVGAVGGLPSISQPAPASLKETLPEQDPERTRMMSSILDYWDMAADSDLFEAGQSPDIVSDMELIGAHRPRSNTAQRLERMKKDRNTQAKVKVVQWREAQQPLVSGSTTSSVNFAELFPKKVLEAKSKTTTVSALTEQLRNFPSQPNNPFKEYARFDGKMSEASQRKKISIYLMMQPEDDRNYPMEVVTFTQAKVQDVVGLICWQYTREGRQPKLKPSANSYCLRIAEETGEVDEDFPRLEPNEPIAKFDFPVLGLVEKEEEGDQVVTIHIEEVFSKIQIEDFNISLREILEQTLKRRKGSILSKGLEYKLEKVNEPGVWLDLDSTLSDVDALEFNLVFDETSDKESDGDDDWNDEAIPVMGAPLYQSYEATMIHKIGRNSQVQLGISAEKVEINPLSLRGAAKLLSRHMKAVTYNVDVIAACDMIGKKNQMGKAMFKLVHRIKENEFRSNVFETDQRRAQEIVKKMNYILQMRLSGARKEYLAVKERKQRKRDAAS